MRIFGVATCVVGLTCLPLTWMACSSETCVDRGNCAELEGGSSDDASGVDVWSGDGGGDVAQPPVGCDPKAEPKDAPKCVVSELGVFVDATHGADTNAGTKEAPVKTIAGALGKLGAKSRVYVCEGTYAERVKLTSAVSLYGGFSCGGWGYSGTKPRVAPTDAGYALEVASVSSPTTVADVVFTAAAGTEASLSSIAGFVTNTTSLTLRRVELVAGAGFEGKTPSAGVTLGLLSSTPSAGTLNGNAGSASIGGAAQLCTCVGGGTSTGGGGGNINSDGSPGETAQASVDPPGATGVGGTKAECLSPGTNGRSGSNAPAAAGAAGATTLGTLTESGWAPSSGSNGNAGLPGQGGGGGGGAGGGGGGGACGGCGGEGGRGGGGGGASIALATLASPVMLVGSTLTSADAGHGAAGAAGAGGGAGGVRGLAGGGACNGGNGGKGGSGGGGGGGAGGISVGVLYKGAKPTLDAATTVKTGAFGAKGVGAGLDGLDGQKADTLEVP